LVLCLWVALLLLSVCGARWALVPLVVWALGQGALVLLTLWDPQWDDLAGAQLTRRYKSFYDAG
jgi:hypothetical protein